MVQTCVFFFPFQASYFPDQRPKILPNKGMSGAKTDGCSGHQRIHACAGWKGTFPDFSGEFYVIHVFCFWQNCGQNSGEQSRSNHSGDAVNSQGMRNSATASTGNHYLLFTPTETYLWKHIKRKTVFLKVLAAIVLLFYLGNFLCVNVQGCVISHSLQYLFCERSSVVQLCQSCGIMSCISQLVTVHVNTRCKYSFLHSIFECPLPVEEFRRNPWTYLTLLRLQNKCFCMQRRLTKTTKIWICMLHQIQASLLLWHLCKQSVNKSTNTLHRFWWWENFLALYALERHKALSPWWWTLQKQ